jgi:hypothetical protein
MRPDMQRKLAEENKKSAAMDAAQASKESLHKKAKSEYDKILDNPNDPRYKDAWDGKLKVADIQKQLQSTPTKASTPSTPTKATAPSTQAAGTGRKFSYGSIVRQDAFKGSFQPGGLFGGPRMKARTDYAASKGKYYSSSDQKTYGSYNDAKASKQSRMTSLASQQRLDKLSSQGAGPKSGRGKRYTAETVAKQKEWDKRGGDWGGIKRGFGSFFGGTKASLANTAADKASDARVKQAGAASIGRYYSSSDGKYYKDYNAAAGAKGVRQATIAKKQAALKKAVKPLPSKTKTPASGPASAGGGGYGGGHSSGGQKVPSGSATHPKGTRTAQAVLGANKK